MAERDLTPGSSPTQRCLLAIPFLGNLCAADGRNGQRGLHGGTEEEAAAIILLLRGRIGASAGGITDLQSFFHALPAKPDIALVVVKHLMPDQPSSLADLIRKWTPLSVRQAAAGEFPEPNQGYVAGPDDVLTLETGCFCTRPIIGGQRRAGSDTIDAFLESLAADRGARTFAVILSGTGSDGAAAAICVKQAGGLVLVQDPNSEPGLGGLK